ncbi:MAG: undecaprenyldiphospho-muramoylpentapeptide beta-N-acetylglucosaminyltransferase [Chloroflexota bacterium]
MRLLLAGGGTGGHVFPELAVVQAARDRPWCAVEAFHLGSASGMERRILEAAGIPAQGLHLGGLRGSNPAEMAVHGLRMLAAVRPALAAIDRFQPHVAFATGGYACVPVLLAARPRRIPVLLFSADVLAGLAIRWVARLADRIAVPVAEATAHLPGSKTFISGYPVRPDLLRPRPKREAKRELGFDPEQPLLLCFGGSQGARTINAAISGGLDDLLPATQILHVTGQQDYPAAPRERQGQRYRVEAFLDDMPLAMAAADLAVCRAGASTLGELPAAGLPAILVPYPYAGGHQKLNAEVLARAGAARVLDNEQVRRGKLMPLLLSLLGDAEQKERMAAAMRSRARPEAAGNILDALRELAA